MTFILTIFYLYQNKFLVLCARHWLYIVVSTQMRSSNVFVFSVPLLRVIFTNISIVYLRQVVGRVLDRIRTLITAVFRHFDWPKATAPGSLEMCCHRRFRLLTLRHSHFSARRTRNSVFCRLELTRVDAAGIPSNLHSIRRRFASRANSTGVQSKRHEGPRIFGGRVIMYVTPGTRSFGLVPTSERRSQCLAMGSKRTKRARVVCSSDSRELNS